MVWKLFCMFRMLPNTFNYDVNNPMTFQMDDTTIHGTLYIKRTSKLNFCIRPYYINTNDG